MNDCCSLPKQSQCFSQSMVTSEFRRCGACRGAPGSAGTGRNRAQNVASWLWESRFVCESDRSSVPCPWRPSDLSASEEDAVLWEGFFLKREERDLHQVPILPPLSFLLWLRPSKIPTSLLVFRANSVETDERHPPKHLAVCGQLLWKDWSGAIQSGHLPAASGSLSSPQSQQRQVPEVGMILAPL